MNHRESVDVVCAAVIDPLSRPQSVVVGLPVHGRLRIVGRSTPLTAKVASDLGCILTAAAGRSSVAGGHH
ncbi:hypothetical protein [Pseudarthrobacter sulfonivorans]|uniref:hypothetical protein n=1 Tax=Pseudarthrobacter sulfonivorans TaxID=121292 RepID=UPI00278A0BF2|nr:hypothetical protein [Pseudarthrobacter sulfonivorans]MDP9999042.1 hypothetical protein [Pseudarthrobacter sulfonivorans]